ncbi:unnamed protein product [Closterium sp. NIES-54]
MDVKGEVTERRGVFLRPPESILSFGGHPPDVHASGLPAANGIAERRIGMVMDVARTAMIHAAAPHFLWPFAVQYAAHQINLQPRVSLLETTPTLWWTGKVGDASAFRVWGSRAFVCDPTADKLSSRAVPCVFLGFPPDAPGWRFYHPASRCVLSSQDITFDESVSYYRLFPYRTASSPPAPLFLVPDPAEPVEVAVDSGTASGGAAPAGAQSGGAQSGRAEPGGAAPARAASGGALGVPPRREPLSPQRLREWYSRLCQGTAGASRGAAGAGGAAGAAGGAAGAGGATGAAGGAAGAGGASGAAGGNGGAAGTGDPEAEGTGPVLSSPPSPGPPHFLSPPPVRPTRGLTERREPESRPVSPASRAASPVRTARAGRVSRPRLPPVPGTHSMTLRPSTAPQRVPLPSPPASSLPDGPDPESDSLRATSPTVTRFLVLVQPYGLYSACCPCACMRVCMEWYEGMK